MAPNQQRYRVGACVIPPGGTCREDPIPPGIYWIDVFYRMAPNGALQTDNFTFWLQANRIPAAESNRVRILRVVHHDEGPSPSDIPYTQDPLHSTMARDWYLFEVSSPVNRWGNDNGLGLPTTAANANVSEEDTIQSPPPLDEFWEGWIPDTRLGKALAIGGAIGLFALVIAIAK